MTDLTLASTSTPSDLFELHQPLSELYDHLEALSTPDEAFTTVSISQGLLDQLWEQYGVEDPRELTLPKGKGRGERQHLRGLVGGSKRVSVRYFFGASRDGGAERSKSHN